MSLPTLSSPESGPAVGPDRMRSNCEIQLWARATWVTFASGAISESKKIFPKIRHLFFPKNPGTKNLALCIAHQPLGAARPSTFKHFHKSATFLSSVCVVPRMSACDTPAKGERQGSGKQRDCIVCALIMNVGWLLLCFACVQADLASLNSKGGFFMGIIKRFKEKVLVPPTSWCWLVSFFPFLICTTCAFTLRLVYIHKLVFAACVKACVYFDVRAYILCVLTCAPVCACACAYFRVCLLVCVVTRAPVCACARVCGCLFAWFCAAVFVRLFASEYILFLKGGSGGSAVDNADICRVAVLGPGQNGTNVQPQPDPA